MRKLKPKELIALTALMSIGSMAEAQDVEELPITNLAGTTTYAIYNNPPTSNFVIMFNEGPPAGGFSGVVNRPPPPAAAVKAKVLNCVQKYGTFQLPFSYTLTYDSRFAWESGQLVQWTNTNQSPGPGWGPRSGGTRPGEYSIYIYAAGYSSYQELFETLAHELVHANGIFDHTYADGYAAGVWMAYQQDAGAKCGGL